MANINELYDAKYSPRLSSVLRSLGGDPDQIKAHWEHHFDHPTEEQLLLDSWMPKWIKDKSGDAADAAHNQIKREIEHLFFAGMPRDAAVAISNVLLRVDLGTFCIVSGESDLTYNVDTFYRAWNEHNPDKPKIIPPHNDIG